MTQASSEGECSPPPFTGALSRELEIVNRKGLHARATAKFVQCVRSEERRVGKEC